MKVVLKPIPKLYQNAFFKHMDLNIIPRVGDYICIRTDKTKEFEEKSLPTKLKVVEVEFNINTNLISEEEIYIHLNF